MATRSTSDLSISGIIGATLAAGLLAAFLLTAAGAYYFLKARAESRVASEAHRLLGVATAVRHYTSEQITPLVRNDDKFHPVTVPAFAAQSVFKLVRGSHPDYIYREPALRPTNPEDLPTPSEVELLDRFRADASLRELSGIRTKDNGEVYYVATPVKAEQECLLCHDTAQRAPASMVAQYGSQNGFGWKLGEVVAIQVITIPAAAELRESGEIALTLAGLLLLVLLGTFAMLTMLVRLVVARPLAALAAAVDSASIEGDLERPLPTSGAREIQRIAVAIDRLRISLGKALKQVRDRP